MTRTFRIEDATRTRVPGLVALVGPPGGGKTESALKLATGMLQALKAVTGNAGPIVLLDTEAGRARHYAPRPGEAPNGTAHTYAFKCLDFAPPHGAADYWEATKQALDLKPGVVIYDSATHEHIGKGGVLERQAELVTELSAKWKCSAGQATPAAWNQAKLPRKAWLTELEQIRDCFFIFNFRAKEGVDFEKKGKEMDLGWEPEGGKEIFFQMALSCLLPARSDGKPLWTSGRQGDLSSMKLPYWAKGILDDGKSINEEHGRRIGEWLLGGIPAASPPLNLSAGVAADEYKKWLDTLLASSSLDELSAKWALINANRKQFSVDQMTALTETKDEMKRSLEKEAGRG